MKTAAVACAMGIALLAAPLAVAADYAAGIAAGNRGDFVAALAELEPLAEQGDARAQFAVGQVYHRGLGAIEPDLDKARRWYEAAARQGDANAQTNLGVMYATGLGAPQDDDIAERWFRMAAAQGNQDAQDNLGALMRRKLTK